MISSSLPKRDVIDVGEQLQIGHELYVGILAAQVRKEFAARSRSTLMQSSDQKSEARGIEKVLGIGYIHRAALLRP
jgi:hypothetical protein